MALLSAVEAAKRLGVSRRRVLAMINAGLIKAQRVGSYWVIDEAALNTPEVRQRRPGRPPKKK
jgi:excisionase family DNA binding protein